MAVNYAVYADVVDIRYDTPRPDDVFLVDTNVWYWLTYTRASQVNNPPRRQISDYPTYINKAISVKSKLLRCGLSLAELSHVIEKTEREIFIRSNGDVKTKEYRHNYSSERTNVVTEIKTAWGQIETMSKMLSLNIDESVTNAAMLRLTTQLLDGYDLFILEAISNTGVVKVITDDGDYVTVPGMQVFTANQNVITAAQNRGKLITR